MVADRYCRLVYKVNKILTGTLTMKSGKELLKGIVRRRLTQEIQGT